MKLLSLTTTTRCRVLVFLALTFIVMQRPSFSQIPEVGKPRLCDPDAWFNLSYGDKATIDIIHDLERRVGRRFHYGQSGDYWNAGNRIWIYDFDLYNLLSAEVKKLQNQSGARTSAPTRSGGSQQQTMQGMIMRAAATNMLQPMANAFGKAMADLINPPKPSPEEIRRREEARREEERKVREAWEKYKASVPLRRKPVSTDGVGTGFDANFRLRPVSTTPVSYVGAWQQLNAANYLSRMALLARDPEEASYLSEQAFQAAVGAPVEVEVPRVDNWPHPSQPTPEQLEVYKGFTDAINTLADEIVETEANFQSKTKELEAADADVEKKKKDKKEIEGKIQQDPEKEKDYIDAREAARKALEEAERRRDDVKKEKERLENEKRQKEQALKNVQQGYREITNDPKKADDLYKNFGQ